MNIAVCVKFSPDVADLETRPDGTISLDQAEWIICSYDLPAVEAAVQLAEASGGRVIAFSAGPGPVNQPRLKKDLLSRGPDELVLIVDEALRDADAAATARALRQAIEKRGGIDLVLCGEGSTDQYSRQVGLQLGERLGWPALNAISKITPGAGALAVERALEDETETLDLDLPAVLSVTTDICPPRLPTMKAILAAGKKLVTQWNLADLNETPTTTIHVLSVRARRKPQRQCVQLTGSPAEVALALMEHLRRASVLPEPSHG